MLYTDALNNLPQVVGQVATYPKQTYQENLVFTKVINRKIYIYIIYINIYIYIHIDR